MITKQEKETIKLMKLAFKVVLLEDKKLFEELGRN